MLQQLKESVDIKNRFGVGFASAEAWDIMQTKVCVAAFRQFEPIISELTLYQYIRCLMAY